MKGSRMKMAAALFAAAVTLGGCGEALYEMTPEEQAAVVSYASHTVAKFNSFQEDGEIFVKKEILEEEDTAPKKTPSAQQAEQGTDASLGTDAPQQADDMAAEHPAQDGTANTVEPPASQSQTATIGEALDLGVIRADYTGSSLCTTYKRSDSFVIDASPGSQLLVLNVKLVNQSAQDLEIDILAMTPSFLVTVNGEYTAAAQTTILPDDLSTYQGTLLAGASGDTVLLFEVPEEIKSVSSLSLRVTMNGSQNTINL